MHSRGNLLYLTELVRFGQDTGRLRPEAGVWWSGEPGVSPRLGELLARRLREAPAPKLDVVRRAGWEAAADSLDVGAVLAAADAALLTDPLAGEIARMAAQGMTDRDIATTLAVSVRTVESHLAAAYRKLGIRSRRELTDTLG